jgi:cell division transport system permease protein
MIEKIKASVGKRSPGKPPARQQATIRKRKLPASNGGQRFRLKSGSAVVPRESVSGQALSMVIAIMAFLACLAVGAVTVVGHTADRWQNDVAREVTIQIRPSDPVEMDNAVRQASRLVLGFEGIDRVTALDDASSARLLEPWLGKDLDLSELPVPKLLIVSVKEGEKPDFAAIRTALAESVPGVVLDDHGAWLSRLTRMAWAMIGFGIGVLVLVLCATVLTVIFATRGAMAGSGDIIEVLHFVGAEPRFIARQFQRHFLILGLRGAIAGGLLAIVIFATLGVWTSWSRATPEGDQIAALFGTFVLGWPGYLGILAIAAIVAFLTAATSRFTVLAQVGELEVYAGRR